MQKLKPVAPSMREKKRYLVYELTSETSPNASTAAKALMETFLQTNGTFGVADMGPIVLQDNYNHKTKRGIVRVAAHALDAAKASLVFLTSVDGKPASARSITVSGAIGTAKKALS